MHLFLRRLRCLFCLTLLLLIGGCEAPEFYKCQGIVTHNGQPVPDVQITFSPIIVDSVRSPMGLSDADGRFEMTTGRFRGVPPGKYKVFVEDPRAADGRRSRTDEAYLYVVSRYCELNSDVQYVSDQDRIDFELKLDTRELPAATSTENATSVTDADAATLSAKEPAAAQAEQTPISPPDNKPTPSGPGD